jgi:hypothetical protein
MSSFVAPPDSISSASFGLLPKTLYSPSTTTFGEFIEFISSSGRRRPAHSVHTWLPEKTPVGRRFTTNACANATHAQSKQPCGEPQRLAGQGAGGSGRSVAPDGRAGGATRANVGICRIGVRLGTPAGTPRRPDESGLSLVCRPRLACAASEARHRPFALPENYHPTRALP